MFYAVRDLQRSAAKEAARRAVPEATAGYPAVHPGTEDAEEVSRRHSSAEACQLSHGHRRASLGKERERPAAKGATALSMCAAWVFISSTRCEFPIMQQ